MKPINNYSFIALLATLAPGCGALEPKDNTSNREAVPIDGATEELRLSPQYPRPSSQSKPGSIAVEKSIWLQHLSPTGTRSSHEQRCLLLAGSSLHSVAAPGTDGSLSATVYAPPEAAKKSKDKICANGNRVRVKANDQLVGLAFAASDARLEVSGEKSKLSGVSKAQTCLVRAGHRIRLTGKRTAAAGFIGTLERSEPPRPTGLMLPDECQNQASIIASPKAIQQALQAVKETNPNPLPTGGGRIVLEKPLTVERGDVPTIMIFPLPPAPQCVVTAGSVLTKVKSAGTGALVATIEHAAAPSVSTSQVKLSLAYCEVEQLIKLKAGPDFQALVTTKREGWFNRITGAGELSAPSLEKIPATSDLCYVTPNRRNVRISGVHATTGEFLGTIVAAQELEDKMYRPGECFVNDTIIAESEGIAKILAP